MENVHLFIYQFLVCWTYLGVVHFWHFHCYELSLAYQKWPCIMTLSKPRSMQNWKRHCWEWISEFEASLLLEPLTCLLTLTVELSFHVDFLSLSSLGHRPSECQTASWYAEQHIENVFATQSPISGWILHDLKFPFSVQQDLEYVRGEKERNFLTTLFLFFFKFLYRKLDIQSCFHLMSNYWVGTGK